MSSRGSQRSRRGIRALRPRPTRSMRALAACPTATRARSTPRFRLLQTHARPDMSSPSSGSSFRAVVLRGRTPQRGYCRVLRVALGLLARELRVEDGLLGEEGCVRAWKRMSRTEAMSASRGHRFHRDDPVITKEEGRGLRAGGSRLSVPAVQI
eukprot:3939398-Rhodomonas_salina.3